MALEVATVFVAMLGHRHHQQNFDTESGELRIQQCNFLLYQPGPLEIAKTPPAGRARHPGGFGQLRLVASHVVLQSL
jgi:hypothetical protein